MAYYDCFPRNIVEGFFFFCCCVTWWQRLEKTTTLFFEVLPYFFYTFFSFSFFEVQNFLIRLKDSLCLSASKPLRTRIYCESYRNFTHTSNQKFENMSAKLWGGSTWLGFDIRVWKGQHKYTNCLNSIIPMIIYHNK